MGAGNKIEEKSTFGRRVLLEDRMHGEDSI